MGLPHDLLETALQLRDLRKGTEAAFRRSISTAYYALFHLIIETDCKNWPDPQRGRVARQYNHKRMREASADRLTRQPAEPSWADAGLIVVCRAFIRLQDERHAADYDLNAIPGPDEAAMNVLVAEKAFDTWAQIEHEPVVQDYRFSLLFKDRP